MTGLDFVYPVFGLQLHSNLAIPEISSIRITPENSTVDLMARSAGCKVALHLQTAPYTTPTGESTAEPSTRETVVYRSEHLDRAGNPALRIWKVDEGQFLRLEYFDGTQFWFNREGSEVWATWPDDLTVEDAATYLLGPVLGLLLRVRGATCLHGSAVSVGDSVIAFVGPEGAGKSTTAAALAQEGCAVVSDDVVALAEIDGVFHVHPAYPYLCLWPESAEALYGSAEALPRFSVADDKRCLSLEKKKLGFESRRLPLRTAYVFGERRATLAPVINEMPARSSFLALVANTFGTNALDPLVRANEFGTLGRLISRVRVCEVVAHADPRRLPDLCRLIRADVESHTGNLTPPLASAD
ncbi:MAG TPA: hypothetical protein VGD60_16625 [Candidatus Acidoferrales bacterium]